MVVEILIDLGGSFVILLRVPHVLALALSTEIPTILSPKALPHDRMTFTESEITVIGINDSGDFFHGIDFHEFLRASLKDA